MSRPIPIARPVEAEPTSFATPNDLLASANAWYDRKMGSLRASTINEWQVPLDNHLAINRLPWHRRLWWKVTPIGLQADHRVSLIGTPLVMISCGLLAFLSKSDAGVNHFLLGASCSFLVMLIFSLWHAYYRYDKRTNWLKTSLDEVKLLNAKPSDETLVQQYLGMRLVAPKDVPVAERIATEGLATMGTLRDLLNLSGLPHEFYDVAAWRAATIDMVNETNAVCDRLADRVKLLRDDVCAPAPTMDEIDLEDEETVPARLKRLLPVINDALRLIALANDALRAPKLNEILESEVWKNLKQAMYFN